MRKPLPSHTPHGNRCISPLIVIFTSLSVDLYLYGFSLSELKGKYPWVFLQPDWNRDARMPQSWSSSSPSLLAGTFPLSLLSDLHSLTHSFPSVPHSTHTHTHAPPTSPTRQTHAYISKEPISPYLFISRSSLQSLFPSCYFSPSVCPLFNFFNAPTCGFDYWR